MCRTGDQYTWSTTTDWNEWLRSLNSQCIAAGDTDLLDLLSSRQVKYFQYWFFTGDHKQLKPSVATHEMSVNYHLDCSLFERMINNNMYCPILKVQHRMRPEISSLVMPIYKKLQNHRSVESYESIRGVLKDVYFVDHTNHESSVSFHTFFSPTVNKLCRLYNICIQIFFPDRWKILRVS